MSVNEAFVIKNSLEVNQKLIFADATNSKVGIGTSHPGYLLDVAGGIGVTDAYVKNNLYTVGVGTFVTKLSVGIDGTTLIGVGGSVGVGTAVPEYLLDVRSPVSTGKTAFYVQGDSRVTGNLDIGGDVTLDDATVKNLNVSGIATIPTLGVAGLTTTQNLNVSGIATIAKLGVAGLTTTQNLNVSGIATISKKLDVGIGGTILTVIASTDLNVVGSASTYYGNIGIGSTIPQQKLDIAGSVKIDDFIYDSANSPGVNGYYMNMDAGGVRWIPGPNFIQGVYVQDDGIYIPNPGTSKSFTILNFKEINSLGIGTSTITPIPNPNNFNIADIQTQDLWGYNLGGNIYRMTNVGINSSNPTVALDIIGSTNITQTLNVDGNVTLNSSLDVDGNVTLNSSLDVDGASIFNGSVQLKSTLIDINGSTSIGKTDYRLASVGTGVSWRPPGVQTKRSIWVTLDGNDSNSGLLEGDAKRTIGAGASIAQSGDTIIVRSGVYYENNPIGLRTDVCLSGQDLRLVTVIPNNPTKDVFHVRRGCLIENLSFAGSNISVAHTGAGAVAFPPTNPSEYAISGYIAPGPATEGPTGRWKSPYVRNCTNFMTKSIGMKINGDHATASSIGANLKCMVLDAFTQYNEAGIGVSITNSGYAQLVSLFTIASDIAVYVDSGGQCDLTNSNSSFGNYGLYAVGVGRTEFTGNVLTSTTQETDTIVFTNVSDEFLDIRKPYDGQALFFKLNLDDYNDTVATGITSEPMKRLLKVDVIDGGSGYSQVSPPDVTIYDINTNENIPLGPEGIIAEVSPSISDGGSIIAVDVVNAGRNYLATQNIGVKINGTPTNDLVTTMESIYYTVLEASESTLAVGPNGRYADAVNLILDNLDFIATEAVDRMLYYYKVSPGTNPSFSIPTGNQKCVDDVKLVLKQICHNLQFGGNDKTYDAAKYYIDHPALLAGEQRESIYTYQRARDLANQVITNQDIVKNEYIPNLNIYTQVQNLSLQGDPINTSPYACSNVQDAINTLVGIVTFAINPTSPTLPLNRTVGGNNVGVTTVIFNEFIPYSVSAGTAFELRRISRILTSGHSFEYIGAGTSINNSTPQSGGVPIKSNEVVALDGAQIPYTSTDQRGNFNIGGGIQINQTTASITGRDFSKAIQAEVTPLILALR